MKMKRSNKSTLSLFLCMVLVVAMTLFTTGCNGNKDKIGQAEGQTTLEVAEVTVLGEGEKQFAFTVVDSEGKETVFEIHTDKENVGEALMELGLLEGEDGPYGLYVKTVNGIKADYDKDKVYWAFYVNGEYAISGVDTTQITEGDTYSFKIEK